MSRRLGLVLAALAPASCRDCTLAEVRILGEEPSWRIDGCATLDLSPEGNSSSGLAASEVPALPKALEEVFKANKHKMEETLNLQQYTQDLRKKRV